MLSLNGFSKRFIDTYIGTQLNKLIFPDPPKITVNKAVIYFPIAYLGRSSFGLGKKIRKLMTEFYPQVTVRVTFKPIMTIRSFFKFKDKVPAKLQSSAVYKYTCSCCNATYIGKTKRQFHVRIFEHLGRSIRTNRQLSKPSFSAIRHHSEDHDHPINKESFSILSSRPTDMELSVTETLYSIKEKPSLCNNVRLVD